MTVEAGRTSHPPARWVDGRPVDAVVFDLDGVLIDSHAVMEAAFRYAYRREVGLGVAPFDRYVQHLGWPFPAILEAMDLPPSMEPTFVAASSRLIGFVRVHDGVPDVLRRLREVGVLVGVATGKSRRRADEALEATGLAPWIDEVVGSDEVPQGKPAPDIFATALRRLDVPADRALVVGDAVADVESARAAGICVAAALWGECHPEVLLASRPDLVLDTAPELLEVLGHD